MPIDLNLSTPADLDALLSDTPLCHRSVGPVLVEAPCRGDRLREVPGPGRRQGRDEMEHFWAQEHHVRALGAYLVDVAIATAVLTRVTRSFGITVGSGKDAQVFVVGK